MLAGQTQYSTRETGIKVCKSKKINRGKKKSNKDGAIDDLNLDGVT